MPLLTCPQCGSAVTALATETAPLRCPVCGAALSLAPDAEAQPPIREAIIREHDSVSDRMDAGEDDSATRAVADERMEPIIAQVRTDHQLRQAAQGEQGGAQGADEATRALPGAAVATGSPIAAEPAWPGAREPLDATQALPISALPPEAQQEQQAPQRRALAPLLRPLSLALATLTLVVVIVVAALASNGVLGVLGVFGGAASTAPTATPAATATPSSVAFKAANLYQLRYPQGWTTQQRNSSPQSYYALFTAPAGGASLNVEAQQATSATNPDMLDQEFFWTLAPSGAKLTLPPATSVTLAGQTWIQREATILLQAATGQPARYAHVIAITAQHGAYVYSIVYLATSPTAAAAGPAFTTANHAYFQAMLASFTFLT